MPAEGAPSVDLSDVTICAADSAFVDLTARALILSMSECRFGDAVLFSDTAADGPFRHVPIDPLLSIEAYSLFCLQKLPDFIETPYALVVQWDGYVVNAAAWAAGAFKKYDYIGAAWHGLFQPGVQMVGNGGFSLRSRKLMKAVKQLPPVAGYPEDRTICHVHGKRLERDFGIRFAPVKIAERFSYEFKIPEAPSFGFHGMEHLWRHTSDRELSDVVRTMDLDRIDPDKTLKLLRNCSANGYVESAVAIYRRLRKRYGPLMIERKLSIRVGPQAAAEEVRKLESLVA